MNEHRRDEIDDIIADAKRLLDDEPQDPKKNYSEWLYQQGRQTEPAGEESFTPPPHCRRKRKKRGKKLLLWLLGILLAAVLAFLAIWFFCSEQPVAEDALAERKAGSSTILLAGTDAGGTRTDTMMLLHVDASSGVCSLISLPRDTYVSGYSVPKLNSAVGAGGMDELMERVTQIIGYRPDGYVLVDLDSFISVVDAVGGIKFDVPQDMYYYDPAQDLTIDLKAGEQRLSGYEAMGLVRFRSGYAEADLKRVEVQRDFIKAAMDQIIRVKNLPKVPGMMTAVLANTESNMGMENYMWLATTLLVCDVANIRTETISGYPKYMNGGSYFVVDKTAAAQLLNECCNPYEYTLTAEDLG